MKCDKCIFAKWERDDGGELRRNKRGQCTYLDKRPVRKLIPPVFGWVKTPTTTGGAIQRGLRLANNCEFIRSSETIEGVPVNKNLKMPTPRQAAVLVAVITHIDQHGVAPSFMEIADGIGAKSRGKIGLYLTGLHDRGWLEVTPGKTRAIKVLYRPGPEHISPGPGQPVQFERTKGDG